MKTSLKTALILIAAQMTTLTALAQTPAASAQPKAAQQQPRSSDKVDLKKLEEKYWSAKDEDYAVIQNRTFSKAGKFFLSGMYGTLMNDPFAKSKPFGANLGYYFTEDFGIEASYLINQADPSESVTKFNNLQTNTQFRPNYNLPADSYAVALSYTPFYAKMAFMNMAIMYFDMGFTAGLGLSNYDQVVMMKDGTGGSSSGEGKIRQSSPHFEIGVMQQLFLSKNFAFRLDIKNSFYNEKIVAYDPGNGNGNARKEESATKNTTYIMLGLTLFSN
ncbi:MAG: outer membrane beta-barrel domain-containing protein [Moraxellaceae bacterium]|nr:outer membrane beta-barrel domain-containing protein [Pseudobdellovibrionaceae bacterium]